MRRPRITEMIEIWIVAWCVGLLALGRGELHDGATQAKRAGNHGALENLRVVMVRGILDEGRVMGSSVPNGATPFPTATDTLGLSSPRFSVSPSKSSIAMMDNRFRNAAPCIMINGCVR